MLFPALISLFLLWFITRSFIKPGGKKNLPPSPPKLPILGNLNALNSLPHQYLHSLAKKHGPLMLLQLGAIPTLIVSSADAAREMMRTHDLDFSHRYAFRVQAKLLYNYKDLALSPYGEFWRQLKSIFVLKLLSNKMVQSFHSIREEETSILIKRIREHIPSGGPVNLRDMLPQFTNYVVGRSACGRNYNGKKFWVLLKELSELMGAVGIPDFFPWLSWITRLNGLDKKVDRFVKRMDDFLEGMIKERLQTRKEQAHVLEGNRDNFLDILLDIYEGNTGDVSMDKDGIKAMLLNVFLAGVDSTSTVMEWVMTELLRHPTVMEKLQNEIRRIVKDKQDVKDEDIQKMHYLKAVIKETLRYHPPIPLILRIQGNNDVKIKGYDVRAGTLVMINAWAIGRDPASWDEPEKFQPERFLNSSIDFKGLDFELIPFGGGRRGCPGIAFSAATIEFVLANLLHKFNWELPDGAQGQDLDMTERLMGTLHRDIPLMAVATPIK
ncbi:hypothetical protein DH2020_037901 [Rehmannia glutinosa]|uniref:Uncharacterized protein n=1 Tax=Rehmannia glutinosa TaxID=99300 RepID=A0ABR0V0A9_REHGL